ncbi:MAG: hypothetical protein WC709_01600 [Thermoleophilia bacterium]
MDLSVSATDNNAVILISLKKAAGGLIGGIVTGEGTLDIREVVAGLKWNG